MINFKAQKQFTNFVTRLDKTIENISFLAETKELLECLSTKIENKNIIIPIIGAFNCGKSTLLNSLIQRSILPTSIYPETCIAMEIHYCDKEYILGIKENNEKCKFSIDEIHELSNKYEDYVYFKVFLNSPILKALKPIVLVDMPGFNSSSKIHNRAINDYLLKADHFVILSASNQDNIDMSLIDRVNEIKAINKDFDFFLSKGDLIEADKLTEVINNHEMTLARYCNLKKNFYTTSRTNSPEQLMSILENINPNILFIDCFRNSFDDICNDILNDINLIIKTIKSQDDDIEKIILELNKAISNIKETTCDQLNLYKSKYTDTILNNISLEIKNNFDDNLNNFINLIKNENYEDLTQKIYNIIRFTLLHVLNIDIERISNIINNELSQSMSDVNSQMFYLNFDDNFTQSIKKQINFTFDSNFDGMYSKDQSNLILNQVFDLTNASYNSAFIEVKDILLRIFAHNQNTSDTAIKEHIENDFLKEIIKIVSNSLNNNLNKKIEDIINLISNEFIKNIKDKINIIENIEKDSEYLDKFNNDKLEKLSNDILEIYEDFLKEFN